MNCVNQLDKSPGALKLIEAQDLDDMRSMTKSLFTPVPARDQYTSLYAHIICKSYAHHIYAAETNLPRIVMVDSSLNFHNIILRHNRTKNIRRLWWFGA